jgi:hypothetical protein
MLETNVDNCTTVLFTNFIGAVFIVSSVGLKVIVVGEVIVYVPTKVEGAEIVFASTVVTLRVSVVAL